jgi:hypothetical protein
MQPLPHFINSTGFIQRSTALSNLNNFMTLGNAISKLPEDGAETPKHVAAFVV